MTLDQVLLGVLVIVTIANISLVVAAARGRTLADLFRRKQSRPQRAIATATVQPAARAASSPVAQTVAFDVRPDDAPRRRAADALPADLAELLESPAPMDAGPDAREGRSMWSRTPSMPPGQSRMWMPFAPGSHLGTDPVTSMESATGWSRIMEIENARLLRYRRPVTIVLAEIDGIRRLADRVGEEPVERLLPVVADSFRKEARGSDWLARVGDFRFAVLMPETDEIQAINYVERVRMCCEPWLSSAAVPLRLAIGWASPPASGDLEFAVRKAEERMHSDRRSGGKPMLPARNMAPRVVSLPPRSVADTQGEVPIQAADVQGGAVASSEPHATATADSGERTAPRRRHARRESDTSGEAGRS